MNHQTGSQMLSDDMLPAPVPWSSAAVRLLQGIVYHDDPGQVWEQILAAATPLSDYFADRANVSHQRRRRLAYLRQLENETLPPDYPPIPKLFRNVKLTFEASLLCVLLRDELRRFEEEIHRDAKCVVLQSSLLQLWQTIVPGETDDVRANRKLSGNLRKLEELKFVKRFEKDPASWEIRPILKARLPLEELERLRLDLEFELQRRRDSEFGPATPDDAEETTEPDDE